MANGTWRQLGSAVVNTSKISAIRHASREGAGYRFSLLFDAMELDVPFVSESEAMALLDGFGVSWSAFLQRNEANARVAPFRLDAPAEQL